MRMEARFSSKGMFAIWGYIINMRELNKWKGSHLKNGDGVVAHHVGATKRLGEEKEDKDYHGYEDSSLGQ